MEEHNPFQAPAAALLEEIRSACERAGRDAHRVEVIGVTKTVDKNAITPLLEAGICHFGENRWQQAKDKVTLPNTDSAVWHFIGRLQSNKVKYIVRHFQWIHSLTSVPLAKEVSKRAEQIGVTMQCMLQVNVSGEETKDGIASDEIVPILQEIRELPGVRIRGLMTMAPFYEDPLLTRPTFAALREALTDTRERLSWPDLTELSMGMSHDFQVAVEEGATMVRIGRRLMNEWTELKQE
ncbi:YggS family pyridoxal phosphate-dependent enzyme [Alicyclobacillus sp. SO9]|uniref:YggS family pyridoxal phosphate-dependent enzyme n=1 Tax=Alicyclobacillus sp. SO9 TaxID=2665646 RepID=UPI001E516082|nr:YggS family pyridoxal phosphate-dependent enzyme [Alicyclobacillus sp. SO9]